MLLSKDDDHWIKYDAEIRDTRASAVIDVPSGHSYLSMHPRYEYTRYMEFLKELPRQRFNVDVIGKSRRNRDIYSIEIGRKDIRPLAVICRVHPYETMGSFLVDGMLKWLMGNSEDVQKFISEKHIIFVPLPNPDGVAEGTCKLTLGGLNFEAGNADSSIEPEGVAVREYFLGMNPSAIFDLHGWMYKDREIILTNDTGRGTAFYAKLLEHAELFNKAIAMMYNKYPMWGGKKNLGGHIADKLGSVYYDTSWTWQGRTVENLCDMGVIILKSYASLF